MDPKENPDIREDFDTNNPVPGRNPSPPDSEPPKDERIALIINNEFKPHSILKSREGTDRDFDTLYSMFHNLNFQTVHSIKRDCTASEMMNECQQFADNDDYSSLQCLVCVILTYGHDGYVYGTAGLHDKIEINELIDIFRKNKTLAGKPKLFFVQTCKPEYVVQHDGFTSDDDNDNTRIIPYEADVLLVQSCIPGKLGWEQDQESWFVRALCKIINDYSSQLDILTMMTRVLKHIAQKQQIIGGTPWKLPLVTSTLTKLFTFNI